MVGPKLYALVAWFGQTNNGRIIISGVIKSDIDSKFKFQDKKVEIDFKLDNILIQ